MEKKARTPQWPAIDHETLPWERDPDDLRLISKTARQKIRSTYEAAIPLNIATLNIDVPPALIRRIAEVAIDIARFDSEQSRRGYDLPALLLRSESAASSQIENLTSSVRNVALAEVVTDVPHNARLIAANLAAMREALALPDDLSVDGICSIHRALINYAADSFGGCLRTEQVWIGGTAYSPHCALYIPPSHERVSDYLDDLVAFAGRDDIDPVVRAAVLHAQFETIHPFIDGNGRTGRTLLHKVLRQSGLLAHVSLPVSAGLLHNIDAYMDALVAYQQSDPIAVVEQLVDALELALTIGKIVARELDDVMASWNERITERSSSSIHRLPQLLAEQPVITVAYAAEKLGITTRAASTLVDRACEYGILRRTGNKHRGTFYQADALIEVLEEVSSLPGIRRMLFKS